MSGIVYNHSLCHIKTLQPVGSTNAPTVHAMPKLSAYRNASGLRSTGTQARSFGRITARLSLTRRMRRTNGCAMRSVEASWCGRRIAPNVAVKHSWRRPTRITLRAWLSGGCVVRVIDGGTVCTRKGRQWSRPRGPSTYVPAPCRNIGARIAGTPFRQPRMTDGGLTTRAAPNGVRDYGPARSSASRIGCALNAIQRSIGPRARSALSGCSVPKVARCDIAGRIASPLFYRQGYTDPLDYQQAARFLAWAFAHGLAAHWTCAR